MKNIIFCLLFLSLGFPSFSQVPSGLTNSKEQYLQKSKNQKKAAWILLAAGTVMAVGGGIGFDKNFDLFSSNTKADIYGAIMAGGIAADLISIPFFIASGKNARRAARVNLSSVRSIEQKGTYTVYKPQAALGIKISF